VFKVLFTLFRNSQDDEVDIKEFSSTFARLELLQMPVCTSTISTGDCWTFPGNLCGLPAGSTLGSDCVMFDDQDAIASPLQILESGYFRSYRSSTPASEKIFSMIMNEIK
jgi:hypothetical protein